MFMISSLLKLKISKLSCLGLLKGTPYTSTGGLSGWDSASVDVEVETGRWLAAKTVFLLMAMCLVVLFAEKVWSSQSATDNQVTGRNNKMPQKWYKSENWNQEKGKKELTSPWQHSIPHGSRLHYMRCPRRESQDQALKLTEWFNQFHTQYQKIEKHHR